MSHTWDGKHTQSVWLTDADIDALLDAIAAACGWVSAEFRAVYFLCEVELAGHPYKWRCPRCEIEVRGTLKCPQCGFERPPTFSSIATVTEPEQVERCPFCRVPVGVDERRRLRKLHEMLLAARRTDS
jgi:predicted RNA-binding Zn-ribbon protein involved in translation (DUF1610 family)